MKEAAKVTIDCLKVTNRTLKVTNARIGLLLSYNCRFFGALHFKCL